MSDFQKMILAAAIRHGLTAAAGILVTNGWLAQSQSGQWVEMTSGIAIGMAGFAWSWWQKDGHAKLLAQLKAKGG